VNRRELLISLLSLPAGLLSATAVAQERSQADPREVHLRNLRQLTFGGQNAEAYFSPDGSRLIFQSTRDGRTCDQIYTMDLDGRNVRMVSTGRGVTSCSFALYLISTDGTGLERVTYAETFASFPMFFPDGKRLVFASSRHAPGPREFNIFLADWAA